jgi:hypothetical protein
MEMRLSMIPSDAMGIQQTLQYLPFQALGTDTAGLE